MPITNVSDTARWVAVYRAMESARPDAIFNDPFADRLAGERGRQIVKELKHGKQTAWAMIVRTASIDEMIMARVAGGVDTVINLAAGLDTRAWRMKLPASLQWFDVDLPEMIEYKTSMMKGETPVCRYEAISADLADETERNAVLRRVAGVARSALVISEGLLVYLEEEQVKSLARALHAQPSIQWWVCDLANPMLLKMIAKQWGSQLAAGNAPMKFAPADSAAFFAPLGWKELEFRSGMEEARRFKREMPFMPFRWFMMRLMPAEKREEIRRLSGFVLLQRDSVRP